MSNPDRKNILCLGFPQWRGNYMKSTVKLISNLAAYHDIVYINYQYTIKDLLWEGFLKGKLPVLKILGIRPRAEKINYENGVITLYTPPPLLPVNFIKNNTIYHLGLRLNSAILRRSIKKYLSQINFDRPVIINTLNPFYGLYNVGKFNEAAIIYYCYDEISHAKWLKNHGKQVENVYLKKADILITTSKALLQSKTQVFSGEKAYIISNGVDFELFNKIYDSEKQVKEPVIGYVGSIDDRLDFELLEQTIQHYPEYHFIFVGRIVTNQVKKIKTYHNVKLTGPVAYEQIPALMQEMHIMIIPFVRDEFTRNIYPMKINEYLASGKPVITTNFADLSEFEEVVNISYSKEEFINFIKKENFQKIFDSRKIQKGIGIAQKNSWKSRAKVLDNIVQEAG